MSRMSFFFVASLTGSTPRWRNANYDAVCTGGVIQNAQNRNSVAMQHFSSPIGANRRRYFRETQQIEG
jgi:hypothetical protein